MLALKLFFWFERSCQIVLAAAFTSAFHAKNLGCTFGKSTNTETSQIRLISSSYLATSSFLSSPFIFPTKSAKCLKQSSMLFHVLKGEKSKTTVVKTKERCITQALQQQRFGYKMRFKISVASPASFPKDQWMGGNCLINVPVNVKTLSLILIRKLLYNVTVPWYTNTWIRAWSNTFFSYKGKQITSTEKK